MLRQSSLLLAAIAILAPEFGFAQQPSDPKAAQKAMMNAYMAAGEVGPPHAKLKERIGNWKVTVSLWEDPSQPPMVTLGTASREMTLGGRILVEKVQLAEIGLEGLSMWGFDNVNGEIWNTWYDNQSTAAFYAVGTSDDAGKQQVKGENTDPFTKEKFQVRMVVDIHNNQRETMEWFETRHGQESKTMMVVYERLP